MPSTVHDSGTQALTLASTSGAELEENELPVDAVWFGVIALAVFLLLLMITYSFRSVAHRR